MMKRITLPLFSALLIILFTGLTAVQAKKKVKPRICITFDDGNLQDFPGYPSGQWNDLLLSSLKKHKVQSIFFVAGYFMDNEKGKAVLGQWDQQGHLICNHTYSHKSYHSDITFEQFTADVLRNDSLIRTYSNYTKLFRFPYLKEGNTIEKRDQFRQFMQVQGYRNGYVTVDASDWAINSRLIKRLKADPKADLSAYKKFYLEHMLDRANYYDSLSLQMEGRQVSHALLLHHNLAAALFMDDLITMFKANGWEVVNAGDAYQDPVYNKAPNTMPAGESLIWALAKESGKYEEVLRYPAEDVKYEDPKMNELGL